MTDTKPIVDPRLIAKAWLIPDLIAACRTLLDHDPDGCINDGHNCTCHVCYARGILDKAEKR